MSADTLLQRIKLWGGVAVAIFLAGVAVMSFIGAYARASDVQSLGATVADHEVRIGKTEEDQKNVIDTLHDFRQEVLDRLDRLDERLDKR